jgi:transposase-like protein
MSKRYTDEEKARFVQLYKITYSAQEICEKYGIARSSLLLWAQQYSDIPIEAKTAREIYLLEKEATRLRIQNQIFRESGCSVNSSTDKKIESACH